MNPSAGHSVTTTPLEISSWATGEIAGGMNRRRWAAPPVAASRVLHGSVAEHAEASAAGDRAGTRMVSCGDSHQGEIVLSAMDVGEFR